MLSICTQEMCLCADNSVNHVQDVNEAHSSLRQELASMEQYLEAYKLSSHPSTDDNLTQLKLAKLHIDEDSSAPMKVVIESIRFRAESLCSQLYQLQNGSTSKHFHKDDFNHYEPAIRTLYEVTLGNVDIMKKYGLGEPYTQEEFVELVHEHSRRWQHHYPFAGFIVYDKYTSAVVGYTVIAEFDIIVRSKEVPNLEGTGSMAMCFNNAYHRNNVMKNVGYECFGSLCMEYGKYLFQTEKKINKIYSQERNQYEGGQAFRKLEVTARADNFSSRIPEKFGFMVRDRNIERYGHSRILFEKKY